MAFITDTALIADHPQEDRAETCNETVDYLKARKEAVDVLRATEPRVFGSKRLARFFGVANRLENEVSGW